MSDMTALKYDIDQYTGKMINENFTKATYDELKLLGTVIDPRAVPEQLWYSDDAIVVKEGHGLRMLNYYGGFEYVNDEHKLQLGDYVVFDCACERVSALLDVLYNAESDDDCEG